MQLKLDIKHIGGNKRAGSLIRRDVGRGRPKHVSGGERADPDGDLLLQPEPLRGRVA